MKNKNEETQLSVINGINPKELGPALIKQAQDQERESTQRVVVAGVQAIMKDIQNQKQTISNASERLLLQQKRLEALNAGEFTVEFKQEWGGPTVVFSDKDLQPERSL